MARKKNLLRVPAALTAKVDSFPGDDVVASVVVKIDASDVISGEWSHVGFEMVDGKFSVPAELVPPASSGRFSKANREGWLRPRRDLPKILKTFSVETPNWGDWSKGSHTMSWTREVIQHEFFPPNDLALHFEVLEQNADRARVVVRVGRVLDRRADTFEKDLLADLNLLQENVFAADVNPASTSRDEYLATVTVDWEILPPGTPEETVERLVARLQPNATEELVLRERFDFLVRLKPANFIAGTSGFNRYFGGQFGDDLVIFENLRHANALYAMYEDWAELSQRSRTELLNGPWSGFDRVVHDAGWKNRVRGIVGEWRKRQRRP